MTTKKTSLIKTFDGDMYIIDGKTPDEVQDLIDAGGDMVRMPNGARINRKAIASIQSYEDYSFQTDQKFRHKKNQYLRGGEWCDYSGPIGINAELHRITGQLNPKALKSGDKTLKGHE